MLSGQLYHCHESFLLRDFLSIFSAFFKEFKICFIFSVASIYSTFILMLNELNIDENVIEISYKLMSVFC